MENFVRAYYVTEMNTLDIWVDEPDKETESKEVSDGVIAKLAKHGKVIGVEIVSASKMSREQLAKIPDDIRRALTDSTGKLAAAASRNRITDTFEIAWPVLCHQKLRQLVVIEV